MGKGSKAWTLREQGMKWREIAEVLGYNSPGNAHRAAKTSEIARCSWPPKDGPHGGRRAYRIRKTSRVQWRKVAEICNYSDEHDVYKAARRYATSWGMPWPLPGFLSKGEIIYEDIADDIPLEEIRDTYGYSHTWKARRVAYKWAIRHQKVWPPALPCS